jgi:asparagine synthase (glutamine-hydrolysing)
MCGIAGLICFDSDCGGQLHESLVRTMCELTAHRGPDDSGVMSRSRFALGSRRLSIIDLSPAGHMPMSDDSGRWWITYNGEVYNFAAVREELLRLGHSFRSRTDTEVILHAYMEWGDGCMDRFVGMFAFAILDSQRGEVALVRDRYGVKPLYYARSGPHLLFASEIKALMGLLERPRVDRHSLLEWSLYRNVDALTPETLVEDVRSVLPGHVVRISNGAISSKQYYSQISHVSEERYQHHQAARLEDVIDDMDGILNEAVKLRLVSDVPVGTLLSGGLDSSLVPVHKRLFFR